MNEEIQPKEKNQIIQKCVGFLNTEKYRHSWPD